MAKHYSGWSNRETYTVALWMSNEYSMQKYWEDQAQQCARRNDPTTCLAQEMELHFRDAALDWSPDTASVFSELLMHALEKVDWREISLAYLDQAT